MTEGAGMAAYYAPDDWPRHRMEVSRFASILADAIAKHGRHKGLTEFNRPSSARTHGRDGRDAVDRLARPRTPRRRNDPTVRPGDLWEEVTRVLGLQGLRVDPQPGTWRTDWPVYTTYAAHPVHRELPPEAGPSRTA